MTSFPSILQEPVVQMNCQVKSHKEKHKNETQMENQTVSALVSSIQQPCHSFLLQENEWGSEGDQNSNTTARLPEQEINLKWAWQHTA